jgi:sporulation protein YlmC with PRC-barrel domain
MTLGNVYDLDLKKNESKIKDVIIQAQGEVCSLLLSFVYSTYWWIDGS